MNRTSLELLTWAANSIRPRKLRSRIDFAEQEIWLDDGPRKGERFNRNTQPWARLFLELLDEYGWHRTALVGGTQGGKSLIGYVILCLYHLFEVGETVVLGLPDANLAHDKWVKDILPVIRASRYAALLPVRGPGSKNGIVKTEVTFQNGATLRFMSGGGGDASRSGFTTRVSAITEADKMDQAGGGSKETDKAAQIHARTDAFGDSAYQYNECTPSFEDGLIWREYTAGTASLIACPCPHCEEYVSPEKEQLVGWQDAPTEVDARERASWVCPECGVTITDAERSAMNHAGIVVHRGQKVLKGGTVEGEPPKTLTLGFRWNAFNNLFQSTAVIAGREWKLSRKPDEEAGERESNQFIWGRPAKAVKKDLTALEASVVASRIAAVPHKQVPLDVERITLGVDVGKWLLHYTALGWRANASPHVIEYGRIEVPSEGMAEEFAILNALRRMRDEMALVGWASTINPDAEGNGMRPVVSLIDARYGISTDSVFQFCSESPGFTPAMGFGNDQRTNSKAQRTTGSRVVDSGERYDLVRDPDGRQYLDVNANHWKGWVHQRLKTPIGQPGAMTLYQIERKDDGRLSGDHLKFARQLLAEKQIEEPGKDGSVVTKFVAMSRNNHWLDSTALACVAGHVAGVRLIAAGDKPQAGRPAAATTAASVPRARQRVHVSDWIKRR